MTQTDKKNKQQNVGPVHPHPPRLSFMEVVENLSTTEGPVRLYIEGIPTDVSLADIQLVRTEDRELAHLRLIVEPISLYDFDIRDGKGDVFEYFNITDLQLQEDVREQYLKDIIQHHCTATDLYPPSYARPNTVEDTFADEQLLCRQLHEDITLTSFLHDVFVQHLKDRKITRPTKSLLRFEKDILADSHFLTEPELTKREWDAIFSGVLQSYTPEDRDTPQPSATREFSGDWTGLRDLVLQLCREKGLSERDSIICSRFIVPDYAGQERTDLKRTLQEEGLDLSISQAGFNAVIRRNVSNKSASITNTDLGRLGESFTHRLLQRLGAVHLGPASRGVCDLSDSPDGDPAAATWAINVKLSLEAEVNRAFELSPEYQVERSYALLVMPRLLELRLYAIEDEWQTLTSVRGGLCVRPEDLAERLQELLEGGEE